jgi:hypothetical protein
VEIMPFIKTYAVADIGGGIGMQQGNSRSRQLNDFNLYIYIYILSGRKEFIETYAVVDIGGGIGMQQGNSRSRQLNDICVYIYSYLVYLCI